MQIDVKDPKYTGATESEWLAERDRTIVEQGKDLDAIHGIALKTFHALWGRDKGHADYDKRQWVLLQLALNRMGIEV